MQRRRRRGSGRPMPVERVVVVHRRILLTRRVWRVIQTLALERHLDANVAGMEDPPTP